MIAKAGHQTGVGASRSVGTDHSERLVPLRRHFLGAGYVAERANRRRASNREDIGPATGLDQASRRRLDGGLHPVVVEITTPHDVGAQYVVEHDVAGRLRWRGAAKHDRARQPQLVGGRRRHAHVIRLSTAAGNQRVGPRRLRRKAQELQLARFVAATGQARAVVPFHPELARSHAKLGAEAVHRFERCREVSQRQPVGEHGRDATVSA